METLERFKELSSRLGEEFTAIVNKSEYNGPVIFFDLREESLKALGISNPDKKVKDLLEMVETYIRTYEQMNSFVLCDDVKNCRFYSTNPICRLLTGEGKHSKPEFQWHVIFPKGEIHVFMPQEIATNFPLSEWYYKNGNGFACMYLHEIPKSYFKYGEEIVGVENYLPEIMYFVMENIKKGCYPGIIYPPLYETENWLPNTHPKVVYWHQNMGPVEWKEEHIRYIPPTRPRP